MRTTLNLIEELAQEFDGAAFAQIVVAFENTTLFVSAADDNRLEQLNSMVANGGEPVGMICIHKREGGGHDMTIRPLTEYADDDTVRRYLLHLSQEIVSQIGQFRRTRSIHKRDE